MPPFENAQIFPLRGPGGALRAARYAGRATRAGVLRTDQATDTGGQIPLMKNSASASENPTPGRGRPLPRTGTGRQPFAPLCMPAKGTRASPVALAVCYVYSNVVSPNTRFERRRFFRHKRILACRCYCPL